ncbi:restriction endonuclease [Enterococcus sp. DIV0800]|uniref:restriction endonuclease n=1 Tax=unclassified Enterococcus TaxID=2608891 RepID=UPI003D2FB633
MGRVLRIVFGIIFLFSSISLLFDSGSLLDNIMTCLIGLVITYFIFPKDIRQFILEKIGIDKSRLKQLDKTKQEIEATELSKEQLETELKTLEKEKKKLVTDIDGVKSLSIENELNRIDKLTGHQFEEYCGRLLKDMGFSNINVTVASGDQGIDILASMGTTAYGFQCKNYVSVVGNKAVQEALAGKVFYKIDKVGVITNNYFTNSAKKLASEGNVELWDRDTLKELLEDSIDKPDSTSLSQKNSSDSDELWSDF